MNIKRIAIICSIILTSNQIHADLIRSAVNRDKGRVNDDYNNTNSHQGSSWIQTDNGHGDNCNDPTKCNNVGFRTEIGTYHILPKGLTYDSMFTWADANSQGLATDETSLQPLCDNIYEINKLDPSIHLPGLCNGENGTISPPEGEMDFAGYSNLIRNVVKRWEEAVASQDSLAQCSQMITINKNRSEQNVGSDQIYSQLAQCVREDLNTTVAQIDSCENPAVGATQCKCPNNIVVDIVPDSAEPLCGTPQQITETATDGDPSGCPTIAGPGGQAMPGPITTYPQLVNYINTSASDTKINFNKFKNESTIPEIEYTSTLSSGGESGGPSKTLLEQFQGEGGPGESSNPDREEGYASSSSSAESTFYETTRASNLLRRCEENSPYKWSRMVGAFSSGSKIPPFIPAYRRAVKISVLEFADVIADVTGAEYIKFFQKLKSGKETEIINNCPNTNVQSLAELQEVNNVFEEFNTALVKGFNEIVSIRKLAIKCDALMAMTTYTEFDDGYEEELVKHASHDGKITCKGYGNDTQDYPHCKKVINFYDGAMVAKVAMEEVQTIDHQAKMMDGQAKLTQTQPGTGPGGGPGFNHTGALEYQKDGINNMKKIANQRAMFDGAKAMQFGGLAMNMPDQEKLIDSCTEGGRPEKMINNHNMLAKSGYETLRAYLTKEFLGESSETPETQNFFLVQSGNQISPTSKSILEEGSGQYYNDSHGACGVALRQESTLILNTKAKESAKAVAYEAAVSAGVNLAKAAILKKQVKTLDGLIGAVDEYEPEGVAGFEQQELMIEECQFNPAAEGCQGEGPEFSRGIGFSGGSLNISTNGGNMATGTGPGGTNGDGSDSQSATGNSNKRNKFANGLGGFVNGIDKGPGGKANTVSAASTKKGNKLSGNAGGGGGGSASLASGGAPGGKGGGAQASGGGSRGVGSYRGGKGGGLAGFYGGGGRGASKGRKPASSGNPFSKLFSKKGGSKNDSLSFRGPAGIGGKGGSIFDRISSRYKSVNSKERLLEYK